jgi:putative acetyltransferase
MNTTSLLIRPIEPRDDEGVARLIRTVMPEFGAAGQGFAIQDPEVSAMSAAYMGGRAQYWVIVRGEEVLGGGGFAALEGGEPEVCELRKMYFMASARGLGFGRRLLELCLREAREAGFRRCYLETLENMALARRLYETNGFRRLRAPLGRTGHYGCNSWYLREL